MAQNTVDDYLNWNKNSNSSGGVSSSTSIFTPGGTIMQGPSSVPLGTPASGDVDASGNVIGTSTRKGDYVYSGGRAYLVPNSPTDIMNKSVVVRGGYKQPTGGGVISSNTAGVKLGAFAGAATGAGAGLAAGGPLGAVIGGIIGAIGGAAAGNAASYESGERAKQEEWRRQLVDYNTAVDFYRDESGKLKYKYNFKEMAEGGPLSSPYVLKLQNQETSVSLGDDGVLRVNVSPVFAQSDYYKSIVEDIKTDYAGLSKSSDNYEQKVQEIRDYIESAKKQYLAHTISYADYKAKYPDASPTAIIAGYTTSFAGNADPKDMDKYTVYTSKDGEITETNAKDYFDNIYNMNKDERNNYVKTLMDTIANADASQDDKAVAYGDLQALYAVSANKYDYKDPDDKNKQSKYQGMLDADWIVTFWAQFDILDDVFLRNGRQEYLNQDESAKLAGLFTSVGVNTAITIAGMELGGNILQKLPFGKALFDASMMGEAGQSAAFLSAGAGSIKGMAKVAGATVAFNTLRSAMYNAARSGIKLATGEDFGEVAGEFGKDLAVDTIIGILMQTYSMAKFQATVDTTTQYVYRDPQTGNIKILKTESPSGYTDVEEGITYEPVAKYNATTTAKGTEVGYATNGDTSVYRVGNNVYVVGKDGKTYTRTADDVVYEDAPKALKSGVVEQGVTATSEQSEVMAGLKAAGLPETTEVFTLPSKDAYAAVAAGKFTKVDSTKVGYSINKNLFNTNAALDYVNERALARTGDRTAWQRRGEVFAGVSNLSGVMKTDVLSGKYSPDVPANREAMLRYREDTFRSQFGKMTKADNLYMKAKESIARAQLAQKELAKDSGIDLVAEAVRVNGKYINGVSPDRAAALDEYVNLTKKYLNSFVMSVKKSGYVDNEVINHVINSDISRKLGYVPMWGKKENEFTLFNQYFSVDKSRLSPIKSWNREGEIVDVKDIYDFDVSVDMATNMFASNMAQGMFNQEAIGALKDAGMAVDTKMSSAETRRKLLMRVENYDAMKKQMKKMISDTRKFVKENVPSQGDYKQMMTDVYDKQGVDEAIDLANNINAESPEKTFNELAKSAKKVEGGEEFIEINNNVKSMRKFIKQRQSDLKELTQPKLDYKTDPIKDIASMSYNERLDLARRVQMSNRRDDGYDEYILLYRVQKGKPDKWRANSRGYKGQFMSGPKGALPDTEGMVWMTADREWAEGPDRATAGVPSKWTGEKGEEITNENIVVLPIKRSDIVNNTLDGGEMEKDKKALTDVMKKNNAKIIQTRGIEGGLKQSEFVFWKDDNPEIFEDGMKLMMDEYNKELEEETQRVLSHRSTRRRIDELESEIDFNKQELNNLLQEREVAATNLAVNGIVAKASDAIREVAKYNEIFGRTVDVDAYIETSLDPSIRDAFFKNDMDAVRSIVANSMLEVAPYTSRASVLKSRLDGVADEWRKWAKENVKLSGKAGAKTKSQAVDVVAEEINGNTVDGYEMGVAKQAINYGYTAPFTAFRNGHPYTVYAKADNEAEKRIIQGIEESLDPKQVVARPGVVRRVAKSVANSFRLLTSGLDASRAVPNLTRDTVHGEVASGSVSYWTVGEAKKVLSQMVIPGNYSDKQVKVINDALDYAVSRAGSNTYNKAYGTPRKAGKELRREYLQTERDKQPNKMLKFAYNMKILQHDMLHDWRHIFEAPSDFMEGFTRKRLAAASFVNTMAEKLAAGESFENQLAAADAAAWNAGNEYTANFGRKGKVVGEISSYTAYFSQNFANIESFKRAYINNPQGVARNFAVFLVAYMFILAETLSDEKTRKQYYRLDEYDRSNSVVVPLGDGSILTLPLDETLAGLMFPFRRIIETMNNVDPVSFYEFVWGTLTDPLPFDMSGFSEGDYFNFRRGIERLMSQGAPDILKRGAEVVTGYNLYYGSSAKIDDDYLKQQGIYDPEAGDYTTKSKNSATLRAIANATGIPQWQLQSIVSNFGSNIGSYVLNTIDKLASSSEEEHGGKDFVNSIFKSFLNTDKNAADSEFYTLTQNLKKDKNKLIQKIYDLNEKMETASGQALYALKDELQKAKDEYATKVGDAVNQYLNAYQMTGGLSHQQANQVYYLFKLNDSKDDVYEYGSVGAYFNKQADSQDYNEATSMGASVLDKYFDQSDKPYLDKDGVWRISPSYSENNYMNTVYGKGMQYEVDLRNLIEGKNNSLKSAYSQASNARRDAANSGDWDRYNQIALEWDRTLLNRISDYVTRNSAEHVLTNSTALDYLENWIMVPSDWMTTKKGRYVSSLAHNASKEAAFKRPYLKYLFGVDTGMYAAYDDDKAKIKIKGQ